MSGVFQLLIGYESGLVVLWDLRTKTADSRFQGAEPLRSVSWLSDGKQLMTAHADGSTWTWNSRAGPKPAPVAVTYPHGWLSHPTSGPLPPGPLFLSFLLFDHCELVEASARFRHYRSAISTHGDQ